MVEPKGKGSKDRLVKFALGKGFTCTSLQHQKVHKAAYAYVESKLSQAYQKPTIDTLRNWDTSHQSRILYPFRDALSTLTSEHSLLSKLTSIYFTLGLRRLKTIMGPFQNTLLALYVSTICYQKCPEYTTPNAIMKWLSPPNFLPKQHDIIIPRQQGTGKWFVSTLLSLK